MSQSRPSHPTVQGLQIIGGYSSRHSLRSKEDV